MCHANAADVAVGSLASPASRLGAHCFDALIPLVAFFLVAVLGLLGLGAASEGYAAGFLGPILGVLLFLGYVVWALKLFGSGTTPGKNLLGMHVVREDGRRAAFATMLVREWVGKVISGLIFSLGYIWILIDPDRQGWHDKLVSTYVVRSGPK